MQCLNFNLGSLSDHRRKIYIVAWFEGALEDVKIVLEVKQIYENIGLVSMQVSIAY